MIKVGIIGCGKITQVRHIPEYLANPNAEIVGYFDVNTARAAQLAQQYGGRVYSTYKELLAQPDIGAVSVCVANNAHAEIAIAALRAGKHVLCEKPMATTLAECEEMVRVAEETGRFLMIGQNQRFTKAHIAARRLIEAGEIGKILSFRTTFGHAGPETWAIEPGKGTWFFDKNRAAMGAMADLGIHKTDLIRFLTGQDIVETTARLTTLDKRDATGALIGVDDNALCMYTLSGGAVGTMMASWTFYGPEDNSTVLYGTQGIMRIYDNPAYSIEINRPGEERVLYDIDKIQTNDNQTKSGVIDAFVESLATGTPPVVSGKEVLKSMRAVFASIESSEKGCRMPVKID